MDISSFQIWQKFDYFECSFFYILLLLLYILRNTIVERLFCILCQMTDVGKRANLKTSQADPRLFSSQPCCTFLRSLRIFSPMQISCRFHCLQFFFKSTNFSLRSYFQIWLYDKAKMVERGCVKPPTSSRVWESSARWCSILNFITNKLVS